MIDVETPSDFPEANRIDEIYEPIITATIIVPKQYLGNIMSLCEEKRGEQKEMKFLDEDRIILKYKLPLNEVATDFYDQLKSLSSGYASFDYEEAGYQPENLVKMDILLNGKPVMRLPLLCMRIKPFILAAIFVKNCARLSLANYLKLQFKPQLVQKLLRVKRFLPCAKM